MPREEREEDEKSKVAGVRRKAKDQPTQRALTGLADIVREEVNAAGHVGRHEDEERLFQRYREWRNRAFKHLRANWHNKKKFHHWTLLKADSVTAKVRGLKKELQRNTGNPAAMAESLVRLLAMSARVSILTEFDAFLTQDVHFPLNKELWDAIDAANQGARPTSDRVRLFVS